jgi:hypothetical protein
MKIGSQIVRYLLVAMIVVSALFPVVAGLRMSGGLVVSDVEPGSDIEYKIIMRLSENESATNLTVKLAGMGQGEDGAIYAEDEDTSPYSAVDFLEVSPASLYLEPDMPQEITLKGHIPEDVGEGGRYALVNARTPPMGEGNIGVALAFNAPILLTISGTELIETGNITEIELVEAETGYEAQVSFENNGNHHYKVAVEAALFDEDGNEISSSSLPLSVSSSIPTYTLLFKLPFELDEDLEPGTYTVEVTVSHENGTVLDTKEANFEI